LSALLLGLPDAADATTVTWQFAGTVGTGGVISEIPDGTPVTVSWTFDTSQPNQCAGSPAGIYLNQHAFVSIFSTIGPLIYLSGAVLISDTFGTTGCLPGQPAPVFPGNMELRLTGMSIITKPACDPAVSFCGGLFPDTGFILASPPPGLFWVQDVGGAIPTVQPEHVQFFLGTFFSYEGQVANAVGDLAAVPEPSSFVLIGTGLAAVAARRWKRHASAL
jgi:hypothetical protein